MTATVRLACENHQPFSVLWRFEQGQPRNSAGQECLLRNPGFSATPAFA